MKWTARERQEHLQYLDVVKEEKVFWLTNEELLLRILKRTASRPASPLFDTRTCRLLASLCGNMPPHRKTTWSVQRVCKMNCEIENKRYGFLVMGTCMTVFTVFCAKICADSRSYGILHGKGPMKDAERRKSREGSRRGV